MILPHNSKTLVNTLLHNNPHAADYHHLIIYGPQGPLIQGERSVVI